MTILNAYTHVIYLIKSGIYDKQRTGWSGNLKAVNDKLLSFKKFRNFVVGRSSILSEKMKPNPDSAYKNLISKQEQNHDQSSQQLPKLPHNPLSIAIYCPWNNSLKIYKALGRSFNEN